MFKGLSREFSNPKAICFGDPRSPSPESTAWNSYQALGGVGNLTGDGLVPVEWAHLPGAEQLTIKGCLHSINIAGTTLPTNSVLAEKHKEHMYDACCFGTRILVFGCSDLGSYLCESFVDQWLEKVLGAVNAVSATSGA